MRTHRITTLLLTGICCLAGRLGWAQRLAEAPLTPLPPVEVQPAAPDARLPGVQFNSSPARPAPVPAEAAAAEQQIWPQPVILLNSRIIVSELASIKPDDIAKIDVYKGGSGPVQWRSLTENGLIAITLKPEAKLKLKTKSQAAIRRHLKVSGPVSFRLNGMRVEDASLRVSATAIAGLDVLRDASETVINIHSAPLKPSTPSPPAPPGTIYIRGVAGR